MIFLLSCLISPIRLLLSSLYSERNLSLSTPRPDLGSKRRTRKHEEIGIELLLTPLLFPNRYFLSPLFSFFCDGISDDSYRVRDVALAWYIPRISGSSAGEGRKELSR